MPDQVQLRGGTGAENDGFTGVNREVTVDTTNKTLRVHDGVTAGGQPLTQGAPSTLADADTIMQRDEWGRAQVADPVDDADVASKSYVDGQIADSVPIIVRKLADESVASSTTLQDDDHLHWTVGANEVWSVEFLLAAYAATDGDIKLRLKKPDGSFASLGGVGLDIAATSATQVKIEQMTSNAVEFGGLAGSTAMPIHLWNISFSVGGTAGEMVLQWAQRVSSTTETRLQVGSMLIARKF